MCFVSLRMFLNCTFLLTGRIRAFLSAPAKLNCWSFCHPSPSDSVWLPLFLWLPLYISASILPHSPVHIHSSLFITSILEIEGLRQQPKEQKGGKEEEENDFYFLSMDKRIRSGALCPEERKQRWSGVKQRRKTANAACRKSDGHWGKI